MLLNKYYFCIYYFGKFDNISVFIILVNLLLIIFYKKLLNIISVFIILVKFLLIIFY